MRAVARQATKGLLLRLRPYSRPVGVAPRQRQNHAKHNPIRYHTACLCLLAHQHRVYPSDFFSVNACGRLRVRVSRPVPQPILRPLWIVTQAGALEIGEKYSSRWRGTIFKIAPLLAR